MPLYEYECPQHGKIEKLYTRYSDRPEELICDWDKKCRRIAVLVPSLVSMQPDEYWSGKHVDNLGMTFTSKKRMKEYLKTTKRAPMEDGMKTPDRFAEKTSAIVERRRHVEKHLEGYAV